MNLLSRIMNALMKVYKIFIGKGQTLGGKTAGDDGYVTFNNRAEFLDAMNFGWLDKLLGALETIVGPILIVVGAIGVIYAIYLGVMLAKAENAEKREESKKRIVNVLVAIAITAALIFLMYLFANNVDWFMSLNKNAGGESTNGSGSAGNGGIIGLLRLM